MNKTENKDRFLVVLLALFIVFNGYDLFSDLAHGTPVNHVLKEAVLLLLSLLAMSWLVFSLYSRQREIHELRGALDQSRQAHPPADPYLVEARKNLADAIDRQFSDWGLSPSEREIGLLLLKGLSLKEIAMLRNTLEKTVRQQASSIYRKSGLSGRHAFAAWFIEDIL